jgi:hypothetical protein
MMYLSSRLVVEHILARNSSHTGTIGIDRLRLFKCSMAVEMARGYDVS